MNRRAFVTGLGAVLALPVAVSAQREKRVVLITSGVNPRSTSFYVAFEDGLRQRGWVNGQTFRLDFITPTAGAERLIDVAKAAVSRRPEVIVAAGPEEVLRAAREATSAIPIVMLAINYDPVAKGYVTSLARPGVNTTGVMYRQLEVDSKQVEFLGQILPKGARIAMMWETVSGDQLSAVEAAARTLGLAMQRIDMSPPYDFSGAFEIAERDRVQGVLVLGSPVMFRERRKIAGFALRHRLPCVATATMAYDSDLLLGYGPDLNELYRLTADYVDRILRGAQAADLPVEAPTKFDLVINMKTAKALGLTIPQSLLLRADRIIE